MLKKKKLGYFNSLGWQCGTIKEPAFNFFFLYLKIQSFITINKKLY